MEQQALSTGKLFVRDLADGQPLDSIFLVREVCRREKKNGEPFLKLRLGDRTGVVEGVVWEGVDAALAVAATGSVVRVSGRYSVEPRYGACVTVRALRAVGPEDYSAEDLEEGPPVAFDQMAADLRELIATVQQPFLRELLERFFGENAAVWRRFGEAPAAKYYHQAYRHGLLEHCLSVAQGVSAMAATFAGIDRDVAVAGALLHDIGKIDAYGSRDGAIELTDAGKLHGEIPLGYYLVRREIEDMPGFPEATAQALLHIVLSHHGQLAHGSPVVPCTREATLVHMIDNLGGRLGSFDRLEKSLGDGERWSEFDRALSGSAWFAPRENGREAA